LKITVFSFGIISRKHLIFSLNVCFVDLPTVRLGLALGAPYQIDMSERLVSNVRENIFPLLERYLVKGFYATLRSQLALDMVTHHTGEPWLSGLPRWTVFSFSFQLL